MKKFIFGWTAKSFLMLALLFTASVFTGCGDDDDDGGGGKDPVVEDGIYIKGGGTAYTDFTTDALLRSTKNEVTQTNRPELLEIYVAVEAGAAGFNIIEVAGTTQKTYGPGADFAMVAEADLNIDEPKNGLWKGSLVEAAAAFTVPTSGLYHVMIDTELKKVAIAKADWGLIGGATPGGWSNNTPMDATFNKDKMEFVVENVTMLENDWKYRYSNGWKVIIDDEFDLGGGTKGVRVNSNFGGSVSDLSPGGDNISNTEYAVYRFTLTWDKAAGFSATQVKTGDGEPLPEYPEELFMIGGAIGGWDWPTNGIQMVPVHSNPQLFWKIVWMAPGAGGFKFAPVKDWMGDFGVDGDATNGVFAKGGSDGPEPAAEGYYMVVVDLENETIEVNAPNVYLIGDCVANWDASVAENKMDVDNANGVITTTRALNAGDLRLHVGASTMTNDWWQAEFIVLNGNIEYRGTGDDQARANLAAGTYTIDLNFRDGTGSIQ
jgi:hypothetical protein